MGVLVSRYTRMDQELELAHGWHLTAPEDFPPDVLHDFLEAAVQAVPQSLAARLGACRISLAPRLADGSFSSQWAATKRELAIELATAEADPHDLAMEMLLCLGQAFCEIASADEFTAYLRLLNEEIEAGVTGEIDEDVFEEKCAVLSGRDSPPGPSALQRYADASLAASVAEYVHCMWHDVEIRTGPEHLPADWLRRRLEMLARWFPPDPGQRLFARAYTH